MNFRDIPKINRNARTLSEHILNVFEYQRLLAIASKQKPSKDNMRFRVWLKHMITRLYSARWVAVRKTLKSPGSKTPGLDGISRKDICKKKAI